MSLAHLLWLNSPPNTTKQFCHIVHDANALPRGPVHILKLSEIISVAAHSTPLTAQRKIKHAMVT